MDQAERDMWAWVELLVTVLSGIAIPLVLGYVSYQFRADQQTAQDTDRVQHAVEMLTSTNWRERFMGVRFLWHYCEETDRYPQSLISALVSTMQTDPNPRVYREAGKLFGEMTSPSGACHVPFDRRAPEHLEARERNRLYLHVRAAVPQSLVSQVLDSLSGLSLNVIHVENESAGPPGTELRYFDPRQSDAAHTIARRVEPVTKMGIEIKDRATRYDTIPNHFELWLGPESSAK